VVVGVLAMNTNRKQRKGLSGNLLGFEGFIWDFSNGAEEEEEEEEEWESFWCVLWVKKKRKKKKNGSPFWCVLW
jgi:hypothetical protein